MRLEEYQPVSQLKLKENLLNKPKFPVIESHGHISLWTESPPSPEELLRKMDDAGIVRFVDLDAGVIGPGILESQIQRFKAEYPGKFIHAAGIDWSACIEGKRDFTKIAVEQIHAQHQAGASVLKIWKNISLTLRDSQGNLIMLNDPRLDSVWKTASKLNMPVYIHVADPLAFFQPTDTRNERYEELIEQPDWSFSDSDYPGVNEILSGLEKIVIRFPDTVFIGAHVGCVAEHLDRVARLLESCPNYYIDIAARLNELGRQPYSSREFLTKYADRILFGTDTSADPATARIWYRFLETRDEYFPYSTSEVPDQGRWNIYGIGLEDEVLKKIYSGNAEKLLFQ